MHGGAVPGRLPREPVAGTAAAAVLGAMLLLAPALGSPTPVLLQDTLKSAIVAFGALVAALLFFLAQRGRTEPLRWHGAIALPLLLTVHALGSMAWSHAYLAGVEAVRWFLFALIAWLGLNTFSRERLPLLAGCIHGGALLACAWAALQFWTGESPFPQSARPSSTFINRNFFAEYVVSALPFGVLLLARARRPVAVATLAASVGFVMVALQMAGTRSALVAMWLQVLVILPLIAWRCRGQLAWSEWPRRLRVLAAAVLCATFVGLGLVPTGDPAIAAARLGDSPLLRGLHRAQSIGLDDSTLNVRFVIWGDTLRAIRDRPLAGLGAGAWENELPRYQVGGEWLETDYYAHNEPLQLVAEYGLVGWAFLLALAAWLLHAAWRSWRGGGTAMDDAERPWRAIFLCSLFALLLVSNAGFPWRLAATGALFAACLGALAASDARLGTTGRWLARPLRWSPRMAQGVVLATAAALVVAALLTHRAVQSERLLAGALRLAKAVAASGEPLDERHAHAREEILRMTRAGIALHPHYRKITPAIADVIAGWGDWENATWIWESVLVSRPHVVAILCNAARGHARAGRMDLALDRLARARQLQPAALAVRLAAVDVGTRLASTQPDQALALIREALAGATPPDRVLLLRQLPAQWRDRVAAPGDQTSASSR